MALHKNTIQVLLQKMPRGTLVGSGLTAGAEWKTEAYAFASLAANNLETAWMQIRFCLCYLASSIGMPLINRIVRRLLFPSVLLREVRKSFKPPVSDETVNPNVKVRGCALLRSPA